MEPGRTNSKASPFHIVGIGASAGGVQALEQFFASMPPKTGMAFVVVTHLSPSQDSVLDEILARHTDMKVAVASDGATVEPDHVYVMPPGVMMTISHGHLRLRQRDAGNRRWMPVDMFFNSLASDCGEHAVGVVLSGGGSDGAIGVTAIKQSGGLIMAQSADTLGPGFSSMPESAMMTGLVDVAAPVGALGPQLVDYIRRFNHLEAETTAGRDDSGADRSREAIYSILRNQTGHDFSGYKTRTFMRRLHRRMQIQQCATIEEYVERLREQPSDVTFLFRDLLINVTSFFRDKDAFESLRKNVVPRLFEGKSQKDIVRIWTPGCSTGEEVYSIAILLREYLDAQEAPPPRVTIFATDIDEQALAFARAGRYRDSALECLSADRRQKYFTRDSGANVIAKPIRDLCVFSPHNVMRDPPFSRMDLISCRNLMIYLGSEAQRRVLPLFHYALKPGGFLFLGLSETIGRFTELFAALDKTHCLFQARDTGRPSRALFFTNGLHPSPFAAHGAIGGGAKADGQLRQTVEARITEKFAPPHVVVNEQGDLVLASPRTGKYLELPAGAPTRQLLNMARRDLRLDLRGAMREAIETRRTATRDCVKMENDEKQTEFVALSVDPLPTQTDNEALFIVVFMDRDPPIHAELRASDDAGSASDVARLEDELRETRERLQTTIEEYETALEELKSANEELVSLNEETQSTNEELESSKEELQSLNEELQTLNHELYSKLEELDRTHSDLNNLFSSTQIATVFLDRNLGIRSFTPAASQLFNLIPTDAGRPLTDLATRLDYADFPLDIRKVMNSGMEVEKRLHKPEPEAPYYLARLTPYRDSTHAIDGVVANFVDVTNLAKSEERLQHLHESRLNAMKGMATGLAHEINQPLTATVNYLKAARRLLQTPLDQRNANIEETLDHATQQIIRAGRIIRQLRDIVARGEPDKNLYSVHELAREVAAEAAPDAAEADVAIVLHLDAQRDRALFDEAQIKLVLRNLLRNAIEAMSGAPKRELTISTSNVGEEIRIDVSDTGGGLSEEAKACLFEPFASTKVHGMGIGLSICQLIIEGHDTEIWAEARQDPPGAIFSFTLPLSGAQAPSGAGVPA